LIIADSVTYTHHHVHHTTTMTNVTKAQAAYEEALAAYKAVPSRSRKLKYQAAQRLHAAMEAVKAAQAC
jgi:hypothetical protein